MQLYFYSTKIFIFWYPSIWECIYFKRECYNNVFAYSTFTDTLSTNRAETANTFEINL